jgi:hypothetical protein
LIQARSYGKFSDPRHPDGSIHWITPSEFAVLSIGTGTYKAAAPQGNGSAIGVVGDLISKILMGGASDLVHSYLMAMLVRKLCFSFRL